MNMVPRKTIYLVNGQLDWAVCMVIGMKAADIYIAPRSFLDSLHSQKNLFRKPRDDRGRLTGSIRTGPELIFSRMDESGGPLLRAHKISRTVDHSGVWVAYSGYNLNNEKEFMTSGCTDLEAGLRCLVLMRLGVEVLIPEELIDPEPIKKGMQS